MDVGDVVESILWVIFFVIIVGLISFLICVAVKQSITREVVCTILKTEEQQIEGTKDFVYLTILQDPETKRTYQFHDIDTWSACRHYQKVVVQYNDFSNQVRGIVEGVE